MISRADDKCLKIVLQLIFMFTCFICHSQNANIHRLINSDGVPEGRKYLAIEDKIKQIWVCSENGITCFFNNQVRRFTIEDGLVSNDVWGLHCDSKNRIWMYSFIHGIQYIENNIVKTVIGSEEKSNLFFSGEKDDVVYINQYVKGEFFNRYSFDGKNRFEKVTESFKGFKLQNNFHQVGLKIYSKHEKNKSSLLFVKQKNEISETSILSSLYKKTIVDNSKYLFFTQNTLEKSFYYVDPQNGRISQQDYIFPNLCLTTDDEFYVFQNKKHFIYRDHTFKKRNTRLEKVLNSCGLISRLVYVLRDSQNNYWVTDEMGELYFIPSANEFLINSGTLKKVYAINDCLFYDKNSTRNFLKSDENGLYSVSEFSTNKIIGPSLALDYRVMNDHLLLIECGKMTHFKLTKKNNIIQSASKRNTYIIPPSIRMFDFLNDSTIVTDNGYIYKLSLDGIKFVSCLKNFNQTERTTLFYISENLIIQGANEKIQIYNIKNNKTVVLKVPHPTFLYIYKSSIYVGSDSKGLHIYDLHNFRLNSIDSKLRNVEDLKVIDNVVYALTSEGFYKGYFDSKNTIVLSKKSPLQLKKSVTFKSFFLVDYFVFISNSEYAYYSKDLFKNNNDLNFQLKPLLLDTKIVEITHPDKLSHNQNNICFDIINNSTLKSNELVYRFKLIGKENKWRYTNSNQLKYYNLQPGNYRLVIASSIHESGIFANNISYPFKIHQPFYESGYFIFIILLLTAFISIIVIAILKRKIKKELNLKKIQINTLQSQLTPHFIFNTLNNLQWMALKGDVLSINDLIGSFSKLIRKILDSSRLEKITLNNEIEMLESYLNIERYRFNNEIDWSIRADNIDTSNINIPSMMIQPFVENAVIHAFKGVEGHKKIEVIFRLNGQYLTCEVIDNGTGMNNQTMLKSNSSVNKSWGKEIINEKIELFNKIKKDTIQLNIKALDELLENEGTIVTITFRI